jgi:hypothetical protein
VLIAAVISAGLPSPSISTIDEALAGAGAAPHDAHRASPDWISAEQEGHRIGARQCSDEQQLT